MEGVGNNPRKTKIKTLIVRKKTIIDKLDTVISLPTVQRFTSDKEQHMQQERQKTDKIWTRFVTFTQSYHEKAFPSHSDAILDS